MTCRSFSRALPRNRAFGPARLPRNRAFGPARRRIRSWPAAL